MKIMIIGALLALGLSNRAEAGCGSILVEENVSGKTYVANNYAQYPTNLTLYSDYSAAFGSALDGHPGGTYRWKALCYGGVSLTFHPSLAGGGQHLVMNLECVSADCSVLRDNNSGIVFKQTQGN